MTILKEYEYETHTADLIVNGYGNTPKRAIEALVNGIMDYIYDREKVEKKETKIIELNANDIYEVIYKVAERALEEFYANKFAINDIEIMNLRRVKDRERKLEYWYVRFKLLGENYNMRKHGFKREIKAVTMHDIEIIKIKKAYWMVKVTVDI